MCWAEVNTSRLDAAKMCQLTLQYLKKDARRKRQLSKTPLWLALLTYLGFVLLATIITVGSLEFHWLNIKKDWMDNGASNTSPPSPEASSPSAQSTPAADLCPPDVYDRLTLEALARWGRVADILLKFLLEWVVKPLLA